MHDARGDDDKLGERAGAAVIATGDAQDLAVVAKIHIAAETVRTGATVDGGVESDAVALGETRDVAADGGDATGSFVAHHNRRDATAGGAIVAVDVAAADAAGRYLNQDLVRKRSRLGEIGDFQVVVFRQQKSFHLRASHLLNSRGTEQSTVTHIPGYEKNLDLRSRSRNFSLDVGRITI